MEFIFNIFNNNKYFLIFIDLFMLFIKIGDLGIY